MSTTTADRQHTDHTSAASTRERPTEKLTPIKTKVSNAERFQSIQVYAYHLWEQAGRPEGDEARERFWHEAEEEINASHTTAE